LLEPAGDDESARAGFVGNLQLGVGVSLAEAGQGALQRLEGIGNGAEGADLGSAKAIVMESLWTSRPI
jgi:hypothetical protein